MTKQWSSLRAVFDLSRQCFKEERIKVGDNVTVIWCRIIIIIMLHILH